MYPTFIVALPAGLGRQTLESIPRVRVEPAGTWPRELPSVVWEPADGAVLRLTVLGLVRRDVSLAQPSVAPGGRWDLWYLAPETSDRALVRRAYRALARWRIAHAGHMLGPRSLAASIAAWPALGISEPPMLVLGQDVGAVLADAYDPTDADCAADVDVP